MNSASDNNAQDTLVGSNAEPIPGCPYGESNVHVYNQNNSSQHVQLTTDRLVPNAPTMNPSISAEPELNIGTRHNCPGLSSFSDGLLAI